MLARSAVCKKETIGLKRNSARFHSDAERKREKDKIKVIVEITGTRVEFQHNADYAMNAHSQSSTGSELLLGGCKDDVGTYGSLSS